MTAHRGEVWPVGDAERDRTPEHITAIPELSSAVALVWTGVSLILGQFTAVESLLQSLKCQIHILHIVIMGCDSFLQTQNTQLQRVNTLPSVSLNKLDEDDQSVLQTLRTSAFDVRSEPV